MNGYCEVILTLVIPDKVSLVNAEYIWYYYYYEVGL